VRRRSGSKNGKRGLKRAALSLHRAAHWWSFHTDVRYKLFTAADEKIPLSVVVVKKKPQYLVFSLHSAYPLSKHGQLPCGKLKAPCGGRVSAGSYALKLMQRDGFGFGCPALNPKSSPRRGRVQGAKMVQIGFGLCDLWRMGKELTITIDFKI